MVSCDASRDMKRADCLMKRGDWLKMTARLGLRELKGLRDASRSGRDWLRALRAVVSCDASCGVRRADCLMERGGCLVKRGDWLRAA